MQAAALFTTTPIERAVPATMLIAASREAALRSGILVSAILRTCSVVIFATLVLLGTAEAVSIPQAFLIRTAAGGTRVGIVVSDKMDKTVVVAIADNVRHPLYKKIVKKTVRLKAHDENNECRVGDRVEMMETRHLSKDKCWRVTKIIEKAK